MPHKPYDPETDGPFGEWMRGGAPLGQGRTVDVVTTEPTWATRDQVSDGPREGGRVTYQERVDQLGHMTREHTSGRRDVNIRLR